MNSPGTVQVRPLHLSVTSTICILCLSASSVSCKLLHNITQRQNIKKQSCESSNRVLSILIKFVIFLNVVTECGNDNRVPHLLFNV